MWAKEITEPTLENLCATFGIPVQPLDGKRNLTKAAYVTALVNRYFVAECEETRLAIIETMVKPTAPNLPNSEEILDAIDCLSKSDAKEFQDLQKKAKDSQACHGQSLANNHTPLAIKALLPEGGAVTRYKTISTYQACHRKFQPKRVFSRRWRGPRATRSETEALEQLVTILWDVDLQYNPNHDSTARPTPEDVAQKVREMNDPDAAPAVRGRGRGRGRG